MSEVCGLYIFLLEPDRSYPTIERFCMKWSQLLLAVCPQDFGMTFFGVRKFEQPNAFKILRGVSMRECFSKKRCWMSWMAKILSKSKHRRSPRLPFWVGVITDTELAVNGEHDMLPHEFIH